MVMCSSNAMHGIHMAEVSNEDLENQVPHSHENWLGNLGSVTCQSSLSHRAVVKDKTEGKRIM